MRLNVIHIYFVLFLIIVTARGIFNFPMPHSADASAATNNTLLTNTAESNILPAGISVSGMKAESNTLSNNETPVLNKAEVPVLPVPSKSEGSEAEAPVLSKAEVDALIEKAQRYTYSLPEYITIMVFDIIALIGILALALKKEILVPLFWKVFLVLFTLIEVYVIYRSAWNGKLWTFIWSLVLILPAPYAIWAYAFSFRWLEFEKRRRENDSN